MARALKLRIPTWYPKHDDAFKKNRTSPKYCISALSRQLQPHQHNHHHQAHPHHKSPILRKEKRSVQTSDMSDSETFAIRRSKWQLKKQERVQSADYKLAYPRYTSLFNRFPRIWYNVHWYSVPQGTQTNIGRLISFQIFQLRKKWLF